VTLVGDRPQTTTADAHGPDGLASIDVDEVLAAAGAQAARVGLATAAR
jgi:hypothetical protein